MPLWTKETVYACSHRITRIVRREPWQRKVHKTDKCSRCRHKADPGRRA